MKAGLFSVGYAGLWGQARLDLPAFIRRAAALGFEGVLLMAKRPHLSPLDWDDDVRLGEIRGVLSDAGVELIGLACYNDFLLAAPGEVPVAEMQVGYIERCCRMAAALGGGVVRVFTGYETAGAPQARQWDRVVELLRECGERADRYGITLAVQNHHDLAVGTAAMRLLLAEVDRANVRAGFDAWSPFLRGEDLYGAAREMGPFTALSIAANYLRLPRFAYRPDLVNYQPALPDYVRATSMSEGEIDYAPFLRGLREGGYDGWLVYEMCSPLIGGPSLENLDRKAADFLGWLRGR